MDEEQKKMEAVARMENQKNGREDVGEEEEAREKWWEEESEDGSSASPCLQVDNRNHMSWILSWIQVACWHQGNTELSPDHEGTKELGRCRPMGGMIDIPAHTHKSSSSMKTEPLALHACLNDI